MFSDEEARVTADELIAYYEQLAREWMATLPDEELRPHLQRIATKMEEACNAISTAILSIHQPSANSMVEQITLTTLCDTLDILRDTVREIRDPGTNRDRLATLLGWSAAAMEVSMRIIDTHEDEHQNDYDIVYN